MKNEETETIKQLQAEVGIPHLIDAFATHKAFVGDWKNVVNLEVQPGNKTFVNNVTGEVGDVVKYAELLLSVDCSDAIKSIKKLEYYQNKRKRKKLHPDSRRLGSDRMNGDFLDTEILPKYVENYIWSLARESVTTPEMAIGALLMSVSLAIGSRLQVLTDETHVEDYALKLVTVGEPPLANPKYFMPPTLWSYLEKSHSHSKQCITVGKEAIHQLLFNDSKEGHDDGVPVVNPYPNKAMLVPSFRVYREMYKNSQTANDLQLMDYLVVPEGYLIIERFLEQYERSEPWLADLEKMLASVKAYSADSNKRGRVVRPTKEACSIINTFSTRVQERHRSDEFISISNLIPSKWTKQAWAIARLFHIMRYEANSHLHHLSDETAKHAVDLMCWFTRAQMHALKPKALPYAH